MADGGSSPRPFSPTLQRVVDRFGSRITSEGQLVAADGALSIQDWNIMESTWFDIEGESIISSAKQALDGKFHLKHPQINKTLCFLSELMLPKDNFRLRVV